MGWEINVKCTKCGQCRCLPNASLLKGKPEEALEAIYCIVGGCNHLPEDSYGQKEKTFKVTSMKYIES